jgi:hypothetical protein
MARRTALSLIWPNMSSSLSIGIPSLNSLLVRSKLLRPHSLEVRRNVRGGPFFYLGLSGNLIAHVDG